MTKVRWGILSTAAIGMEKVIPAIQRAHNCQVVAIASRVADRAAAAARDLRIPAAYGSYDALLASPDVDAVYIPLPNHLHAPWTIAAASAGKHVLCEKPLALTASEAQEMARACEMAGVKFAEAFMYRQHATWAEAVRLIRDGVIGQLQAVQSWFSFYNDDPNDIRNRIESGGGAMMDIGCYNVSLSRMLFAAEPTEIQATIHRDPVMEIDTVSSALLTFPGGGQATFTCSIRAQHDERVHIAGTRGAIELATPFNIPPDRETSIRVTAHDEPAGSPRTEVLTFAPEDAYTVQAQRFAQAIIDDTDVPVPINDALANMRVVEAVLGSG